MGKIIEAQGKFAKKVEPRNTGATSGLVTSWAEVPGADALNEEELRIILRRIREDAPPENIVQLPRK